MSLIVEDGSLVTGAESYCSVAAAAAYHVARGNATWATITNAQMEEALRRATDYMEQAWRAAWKGHRVTATQALSWPRYNVEVPDSPYRSLVPITQVPTVVINACAELALRAAAGELAPDLKRGKSSVTIGSVAISYDTNDPQNKRFQVVAAMLMPYFDVSPNNARVIPT